MRLRGCLYRTSDVGVGKWDAGLISSISDRNFGGEHPHINSALQEMQDSRVNRRRRSVTAVRPCPRTVAALGQPYWPIMLVRQAPRQPCPPVQRKGHGTMPSERVVKVRACPNPQRSGMERCGAKSLRAGCREAHTAHINDSAKPLLQLFTSREETSWRLGRLCRGGGAARGIRFVLTAMSWRCERIAKWIKRSACSCSTRRHVRPA